jgi:site-specific DNA-methyltransferase (adenine-specific)
MNYPDDFHNKIIQGDCLDVMPFIPDKSINLVIADPPFCIGTTSNGQKGEWLDNNLIKPFFDIYFNEIKRVLKDDGEFYINTDWRTYPFLYPIIIDKLIIKNCIVWDYEWIKAGSHYRFSHEFIIYGLKEKSKRKFSARERDVWRIKPMNFTLKNKRHNTEKPEELVEKMVLNSSNENDIVLDTFIGSGTTAAVCKKHNRNFIGIELSDKHCETARKRVNATPEPLFKGA